MKLAATLRSCSPLLVSALVVHALLGGCQAVPRYALTSRSPHKDCLAIRVRIDRRQDPEVYRSIASVELEKILREKRELPLYEVRFEFHRGNREKLALVVARPQTSRPTSGTPIAIEWETFLYP